MKEKEIKPANGFAMFLIGLLLIISGILLTTRGLPIAIVLAPIGLFLLMGLMVVNPNQSRVLVFFGAYKGTVRTNGFFWVNPLFVKKKISLRAKNLDSTPIKVNDKMGNPIMIGTVLVWRVKETYKAAFEVDDFQKFVGIQTEAAVRKLAGDFAYDNFEDHDAEITLRDGGEAVNGFLETEISERLAIAGIEVLEARISHLAYSNEIAGAMLQRQQATAVVAARHKIVEGAVSMVQMALEQLKEEGIVDLDEEKRAAMVSNLMVVLCSDKAASPVVNTGTLYQ